MLGYLLCSVAGFMAGFALMFEVAKRMVDKVRAQEETRHQELITHMDGLAGEWQDIVLDIQREVQLGHMAGKSIKDQLMVVKSCIARSGEHDEPDEEVEVVDVDGSDRGKS